MLVFLLFTCSYFCVVIYNANNIARKMEIFTLLWLNLSIILILRDFLECIW